MKRALALMARHFKGEATLNHLRVRNFIGLRTLFDRRSTTNKEISEVLGIPASTVSRIVAEMLARGYLSEQPHQDDHRVRLLTIVDGHPLAQAFESELKVLLDELLHEAARAAGP